MYICNITSCIFQCNIQWSVCFAVSVVSLAYRLILSTGCKNTFCISENGETQLSVFQPTVRKNYKLVVVVMILLLVLVFCVGTNFKACCGGGDHQRNNIFFQYSITILCYYCWWCFWFYKFFSYCCSLWCYYSCWCWYYSPHKKEQ